MPQPYPKQISPSVRIGDAAYSRPLLSQHAIMIISQLSQVDSMFEFAVAGLVGGDGLARELIDDMRSKGQKRKALNKVARKVLSEDDALLFAKVVSFIDSAAKARDVLAHWVMAVDDQLPDALIYLDPRGEHPRAIHHVTMTGDTTSFEKALRQDSRIWREADFSEASNRLKLAYSLVSNLGFLIRAVLDPNAERFTEGVYAMRTRIYEELKNHT